MKFKKDLLQRLLFDDLDENEDYTVIEDKLTDTSRWSIYHEMIFKTKGNFYSTTYSNGATELQEESPYEYDDDEIECEEVFQVKKTIIAYEPKILEKENN